MNRCHKANFVEQDFGSLTQPQAVLSEERVELYLRRLAHHLRIGHWEACRDILAAAEREAKEPTERSTDDSHVADVFPARTAGILERAGYVTVGQVRELMARGSGRLCKQLGERAYAAIRERLKQIDDHLRGNR